MVPRVTGERTRGEKPMSGCNSSCSIRLVFIVNQLSIRRIFGVYFRDQPVDRKIKVGNDHPVDHGPNSES